MHVYIYLCIYVNTYVCGFGPLILIRDQISSLTPGFSSSAFINSHPLGREWIQCSMLDSSLINKDFQDFQSDNMKWSRVANRMHYKVMHLRIYRWQFKQEWSVYLHGCPSSKAYQQSAAFGGNVFKKTKPKPTSFRTMKWHISQSVTWAIHLFIYLAYSCICLCVSNGNKFLSENNFTVSPVSGLSNTQILAKISLHRMVLPAVVGIMTETSLVWEWKEKGWRKFRKMLRSRKR